MNDSSSLPHFVVAGSTGLIYPAAIVYGVIFVVCVTIFVKRMDLEPIKSREPALVLCSVTVSFIFFIIDSVATDFYDFAFGPNVYVSCHLDLWPSGAFIAMWTTPYFVRAFRLGLKFMLQQANLVYSTSEKIYKLNEWVFLHRWLFSWQAFTAMYATLFVVLISITAAIHFAVVGSESDYYLGVRSCTGPVLYFIAAQGALAVLALIVSIVILWKVRDIFAFKNELIGCLCVGLPLLILWAAGDIGDIFPDSFPTVSLELLAIALMFMISVIYPIALSFTSFYRTSGIRTQRSSLFQMSNQSTVEADSNDIPELGSSDFLTRLLEDPVLLPSFERFSVESFCVENVLFYKDIKAFSKKSNDDPELLACAKQIYSQFFTNFNLIELNLESSVVTEVYSRIENNKVDCTLFNEALKQVFLTMRTDTYRKYLLSARFAADYPQSLLYSRTASDSQA